jgi:hypothetical protein
MDVERRLNELVDKYGGTAILVSELPAVATVIVASDNVPPALAAAALRLLARELETQPVEYRPRRPK